VGNIFLTPEGYEKLKKEIDFLKKVRRRELSEEIGRARAQGDISENAEYDAAKEAQALNEKRIAELEDKLARAQLIDDSNIAKEEIRIGATVKLKDLTSEKELQYTLLSELEADVSQGIISVTSPVGKALLGHKENEIVEIKIPAGTLKYRVLKISR
jgi:transcription elongation factor GreA